MNRLTKQTVPLLAATLLLCLVPGTAKASDVASSPALVAPVRAPELVRSYLQPTSDYSAGHRGVDYRVSLGQEVLAPVSGTVWFAGKVVNRPVVTFRRNNGDLVSIEPVCASLTSNMTVVQGDVIGQVCDGDQSYRPHCEAMRCLHFSYRTADGYLSPIWVMGKLSPSVLAPWTSV
ncbi:MAG: M23 family metallopeptidase [Micrococcales bacterium]